MNEYISEAIQYLRIIGRSVLADEVSDLHKAAATLAVEKAEQAAAIRALQARANRLDRIGWQRLSEAGTPLPIFITLKENLSAHCKYREVYAIRPTESGKGE